MFSDTYFHIPDRRVGFLFSKAPKSALESTQFFIKRVTGTPLEIKPPGREAD
jgi:hypothetical protein